MRKNYKSLSLLIILCALMFFLGMTESHYYNPGGTCSADLAMCWEELPAPGGCPYPSVCNPVTRAAEVECLVEYSECMEAND